MNILVRRFHTCHFFLVFVVLASARVNAQPVPAAAQETQSQSAAAQYQLKLPVPLVIEDVVVLDNKEQPVHGLKASDFIVTENGKRVELRNLEEHVPPSAPATLVKAPPLGVNLFTNVPDVPQSTSLNILLFDALNTPTSAQALVHQQMLQFLKNLTPGTRVAIFGLGARLHLLQGFTDDPAILLAALENKNAGPQTSPLLEQRVSEDPANPQFDSVLDMMMQRTGYGQEANSALNNLQARQSLTAVRQRMAITMQAMSGLARYLSVLPGHKNLIWFSGSFPLNILPNDQLSDPLMLTNDFRESVRQTADIMARGRVAIYPVDVRGLTPNSSFNPARYGVNHREETHNLESADAASKHFDTDPTYAEHDTMDVMAADTGGKAFYNTNGLKDAVDKIIRYGESYYTIAYSPPNQKFDGTYRKIVINSGQLDMHLSYRVGYFADDPDAPPSGKKSLPLSTMETAMLHGVPDAIQVRFNAGFIPGENPVNTLTPGGKPDASRMKPPYMNYKVQYTVDIRSVQFTVDANKVHHGSLELAAFVYDREGNPINMTLSMVNIDLPDERFERVAQQGAITHQTIDAPAHGEYYLRVGILDLSNDHVGALEVPLSKLKSLQELRTESAKEDADPAK